MSVRPSLRSHPPVVIRPAKRLHGDPARLAARACGQTATVHSDDRNPNTQSVATRPPSYTRRDSAASSDLERRPGTTSPADTPLAASEYDPSASLRFVRTVVASEGMNAVTTRESTPSAAPRGTCPRCGTPWVGSPSGRRRKWCSQACRRAAYEERRAAAAGAIAVREVDVSTVTDHDLSTCVNNVADSPTAVRRLLRSLCDADRLEDLATELRWESARKGLSTLLGKITSTTARHSPQRWPQVLPSAPNG
jgi:endogenous inhibitor of DNA gyrase (YacG/DUF329 family)